MKHQDFNKPNYGRTPILEEAKTYDRIKRVTLFSWDQFGVEQHPIVRGGDAKGQTVADIQSTPGGVMLINEAGHPIVEYLNIPMSLEWETAREGQNDA